VVILEIKGQQDLKEGGEDLVLEVMQDVKELRVLEVFVVIQGNLVL